MSESDSDDSSSVRIRYKTENTRNITKHYDEKERTSSDDEIERNQKVVIGPSLPPHLLNKRNCAIIGPEIPPHLAIRNQYESKESIGPVPPHNDPQLSPHLSSMYPQLPPYMDKKPETTAESEIEPFGPSLPPHLKQQFKSESDHTAEIEVKSFGPSLPPHLKQRYKNESDHTAEVKVKSFGPSLPDHLRKQLQTQSENSEEDDQEDVYGPLPADLAGKSSATLALEERALQMQIDKLRPPENEQTVRESWMIELPEAKAANFGLGPRQFRNKAGPDMSDRSSWTDIGGEKRKQKKKAKPLDLKAEAELRELHKRDKQQELLAKKHKRKSKSLVEIHEEKIKKKNNSNPSTTERKPFNRETDLQVNKFDEAQKKAVLKKAQLLDDRFSSGQSKFL